MEKKIYENDLGTILLRTAPRATRYTLKISKGMITATMPVGGDEGRMLSFIEENRQKLLNALKKHPARPLLNETARLETTTFLLHIFRTERANFYMKLDNSILHIACPLETRFESDEVQLILKGFLEKALRHEAKRLLPDRLKTLADRYKLTFTSVRIMNSKTRWGSCSTHKSINLSLSLMLLPWHLIDYVLLHELCHTVEMNHSDRFWKLLNEITENRALMLRQELKKYSIL